LAVRVLAEYTAVALQELSKRSYPKRSLKLSRLKFSPQVENCNFTCFFFKPANGFFMTTPILKVDLHAANRSYGQHIIQAFVPEKKLEAFKAEMERVFGEGSCYVLSIRPVGGVQIDL